MLNFVHIGIGQCGNRFAEQFGGRNRTAIAINTARVDMSGLDNKSISPKNQLHIALDGLKDGAGRDPEIGRRSMEANLDMICEAVIRATRDKPADRIVLWAGLGGGTGTGGVLPLMKRLTDDGYKVMLGLTLPKKKEGWVVRMNAIKSLTNLIAEFESNPKVIVPYLVIDNEKIAGGLDSQNEAIAYDLTRFVNTTMNIPAASAFDDTDFSRLLGYRGMLTVVRTKVPLEAVKGGDVFADAVKEAWSKSLYAKFSAEDATGAALLVIVPDKFLAAKGNKELIEGNIEGVEALYSHANPYSCIYAAKNDDIGSVIIYSLLTGLPAPDENLDEIYDDVSERISEDKERRRERKKAERQSRAKRRLFDYDPNAVDDEDEDFPAQGGESYDL